MEQFKKGDKEMTNVEVVNEKVKEVMNKMLVDTFTKLLNEEGIFTEKGKVVVTAFIKELSPSEMDKLEAYLKENDYNYVRNKGNNSVFNDFDQIECDGWDVVCHSGSYGGRDGLLESYGMKEDDGDVTGWQTAEDIIERLEEGK